VSYPQISQISQIVFGKAAEKPSTLA